MRPIATGRRASRARCGVYDCSACDLYLEAGCPGCGPGNLHLVRAGERECAVYACVRKQAVAGCHECRQSPCRLERWQRSSCPLAGRFGREARWDGFKRKLASTRGISIGGRATGLASPPRAERLRGYLAVLGGFSRRDVETISSHQLARGMGVRASLVRRDLSVLGHLGRPGKGYDVADLETRLRGTLRLGRERATVWLGAHGADWTATRAALLTVNCKLVGVFDDKCPGQRVCGLVVQPLSRAAAVARRRGAQVAVLATPEAAQASVLDGLVQVGVTAVLNLTPARLDVSAKVVIEQGDIGSQLLRLVSRI